jgi:hypothetical protein
MAKAMGLCEKSGQCSLFRDFVMFSVASGRPAEWSEQALNAVGQQNEQRCRAQKPNGLSAGALFVLDLLGLGFVVVVGGSVDFVFLRVAEVGLNEVDPISRTLSN